MKTIIGSEIGMATGALISLMWLEPIHALSVFLIMNIGYWCRYISERAEANEA